MRDLQKDLAICNKATKGPWVFDEYDVDIWSRAEPWRVANVGLLADIKFIAEAREGWPYAIERAIKAEAENALLHKVAEAARVLSDIWSVGGKPNFSNLRYALAELDKEGE